MIRGLVIVLIGLVMLACPSPLENTSKSTNADLSGITLSIGTLSPAFAAATTAYTVSVANTVTSITITGTKADTSASVSAPVTLNALAEGVAQTATITVTAESGTTKVYTVAVTRAASGALNSAMAITAFNFTSPAATGIITEETHSIAITVPNGTVVTALVPSITHTGSTISPSSGVARDFTSAQTYTVTAADSSTQAYTVTVTVASSSAKAITAFNFTSPAATGIITEATHSIAITVPNGTIVTALVPSITHTGSTISPSSGVARDFTSAQTYTVTAADSSTQAYTVTVNKLAAVTTTEIAYNLTFTVDIAGTSAKGGGEVTNQGSSAVTERGVCWGTSANPTISGSHAADGSGTGIFSNASMTGLTVCTTYHVRAYVTNSQGTVYGNEIAFYSGYAFGFDKSDGYVFYNNGSAGGLVAAKTDQSTSQVWIAGGSTQTTLNGNTHTGIWEGDNNTWYIWNQTDHTGSAAAVCNAYSVGGSGWFLPSRDELNLMFLKLKVNGIGGFADNYYWSSSEYNYGGAWTQYFYDGYQTHPVKDSTLYVRAIRAF